MCNAIKKIYSDRSIGNKIYLLSSAIIILVLFLYIAIRAYYISITYDESYTYLQFVIGSLKNAILFNDPNPTNNHVLYILLAKISILFGDNGFILRMPSIVAYIIYSLSAFLILCYIKNKYLRVLGLIFILSNPFLLDFFSLARGYGLALGFMLLSLYFLLKFSKNENKLTYPSLSIFFAGLSSLSNLVFFNYLMVSFFLIIVIFIFYNVNLNHVQHKGKRLSFVGSISIHTFIFSVFLIIIMPIYFKLKYLGQLYFGGENGFFNDTVLSIVKSTLYGNSEAYVFTIAKIILVSFIFIVLAQLMILYLNRTKLSSIYKDPSIVIPTITFFVALSTIFQHYATGSLYLIERTALIFIPLYSLSVIFFINSLYIKNIVFGTVLIGMATIVAGFMIINFTMAINTKYALSWKDDADTKELVMQLIEYKDSNNLEYLNVSTTWQRQQSMLYYKQIWDLNWLNIEISDIPKYIDNDFNLNFYDHNIYNGGDNELIKSFSVTKYVLFK